MQYCAIIAAPYKNIINAFVAANLSDNGCIARPWKATKK
jgi:hypothetical protein